MLSTIDIKYFKLAVGMDAIGKETPLDINARCPVCGDSKKNKRSKRLHLYTKDGETGHVNCFNGSCPAQNKTMYSFLRDFYPEYFVQYKKEQFGNTIEKLASGDVFSSFKKEEPKSDILTHDLSLYMKNIEEVPEALEYIKKRGFNYKELKDHYGKWYFGYQDLKIGETIYKITNAIVIPLYYNNEMYGFYSRNIENKTFYTYMHDANIGYKLWNWFNIDKSSPCYIFEGIFDALASGLPNCIAAIGAKIPDDRIKELKFPIFCYDNDKTGLLNALQMARKGHKVYVQPNNIFEKDMNEILLNHSDLRISQMINNNLYQGISAEVKIKAKL